MADKTCRKGWTIIPPDHNSPWWDAERPSGRTTATGESIPESMGATTRAALFRAIDRRSAEEAHS